MVTEVQRGGDGQPKGPDKSKIANAHVAKLVQDIQKVRAAGGVTVHGIDGLSERSKTYLKNAFPELVAAIGHDGKIPTQITAKMRRDLHRIEKFEQHVAEGPKGQADKDGVIDERKMNITDEGVSGMVGGALSAMLSGFGLDKGGFNRNIAAVIRGSVGKNLADPETWKEVGGKMLAAVLSGDGDMSKRLGDAVGAGAEALVDAATATPRTNGVDAPKTKSPPVDKFFGPTPKQGLGLESTASQTSGTGSFANAFNIRAQLLTGLTGENPKVVNVAGKLCSEIFQDIGVFQQRGRMTPEEAATKKEIHRLITSELNALQKDGKIDPSALLDRLATLTAEGRPEDPTATLFASMADGLRQLCEAHPESMNSEEIQASLALGCSFALSDLVAIKLGKEPKYNDALTTRLVPMLGELVSTGKVKDPDAKATPGAQKADLSRYTCSRPDLPTEAIQAAEHFLAEHKVDPHHKDFNTMVKVLGEIFTRSQADEIPPPIVAYQWLAENAGLSKDHVRIVAQHLNRMVPQFEKLDTLLKSREAEYEQENKKLGSSQDHGRLRQLSVEIASLREQMRNFSKLPTLYMQHAADMIAETCVTGKMHGNAPPPPVPPGSPPNAPEGDPGDGGGGGGGRANRGRNPYSRGNMPGMTSHAGPHDEVDEPFYQRRANMLGDILADPSLCIEDKIFYFMMWFVAFADEERETKMEELIQMDRKQAELAELKDQKNNELQSMYGTRRTQRAELKKAEDAVNKLNGRDPPAPEAEVQQAAATLEQAQANSQSCDGKIADLEQTIQGLKRDSDDLPKSREVKFMELERLNQLRDKIMNMARSILENSNRNIEKIFR